MAENNAINKQTEDLIVNKAAGDPFVNFQIGGTDKYTIGVDDDDSDILKITDGADPSSGETLIEIRGTPTYDWEFNCDSLVMERATVGATAQLKTGNTDNSNAASHYRHKISTGGASAGDPWTLWTVEGLANYSIGIDNSDSDKFKICSGVSPSAGTERIGIDTSGNISFYDAYTFPIADGNAGEVLTTDGAGTVSWAARRVIQKISNNTTALVTCSTALPADDTIPQNTEGSEVLTVTITPTSATNILEIDFNTSGTQSASNVWGVAFFQDTTANAIAAGGVGSFSSETWLNGSLKYRMVAGTTSSTTFKVRCGKSSGSIYINGDSVGRKWGGVSSTYLTVTEYQV